MLAHRARLGEAAESLARLDKRVRAPERALALRRQHVDELSARLEESVRRRLATAAREREALERRLSARHPRAVIADARHALAPLPVRLGAAMRRLLDARRARLGAAAQNLQAISPLTVLSRGYAITLDERGHAVRDAREVPIGARITVRLDRGALDAEVKGRRDE
ncbi:MAG: hypothetical protein K1X94_35120 [Sandaracinaceae bacterium]|nr:hypothetical protein [Sandaracinaceae bacterium]